MQDGITTQCVLFEGLFDRPVVASFDEPQASSDGGLILLAAVDRSLRLTDRMAECLSDAREPGKVRHSLLDLVRERVFGIAGGYPDANDAARLAEDPVQKLLLGRDPVSGDSLASQPTLSRFENSVRRGELLRLGERLADAVFERHAKRLRGRVRRITLDLDPTHDPTHGSQQLTLFNGFYDTWCYLPLLGFVSFNDEPQQYLFAALLRPGNAATHCGVIAVLERALQRLRRLFPKTRLRVRLDGGFPNPQLLDYLDQAGVEYVVGLPQNSKLNDWVSRELARARRAAERSGETEHVFTACNYRTRRWRRLRRVVVKAEVVCHGDRPLRDNPRYVVTNLTQSPQFVYQQVYCQRGDVENRIKELKGGLAMDRTSCSRFFANQLRLLLSAAAYMLMQELRLKARHTTLRNAQISTLRERLLKIGARVVASVRRILFHLPDTFAWRREWLQIATALGARAG